MASSVTELKDARVVPHEDWVEARKAFLAKEKEFSRMRDELSRQRRELPWEKVEKNYVFEGPNGKVPLAELFDGRGQLIIYHFMMGPGWSEGCKSCSFLADHFDGPTIHLGNRDVTFAVVSRAPMAEIAAFKERMGWRFRWVSSFGSDFNYDYHVSFTPEERASGKVNYNYEEMAFPSDEGPGLSVFAKNSEGIFHTYSSYSRGLDIFLGTYNFLDVAPKGRDEEGLAYGMAWVRHHDKYDRGYFVDPKENYVQPKIVSGGCCSDKHES